MGWNCQEGSDEVGRSRKIREDLGLPFREKGAFQIERKAVFLPRPTFLDLSENITKRQENHVIDYLLIHG